ISSLQVIAQSGARWIRVSVKTLSGSGKRRTKKPHPTPPRRAFPRRNEEKRRSHSASAPRDGPRSGGDGTDGNLLRDSSRQSVRCAPSSITFSQRTLDRVAWAER